jgi:hypothetical protein
VSRKLVFATHEPNAMPINTQVYAYVGGVLCVYLHHAADDSDCRVKRDDVQRASERNRLLLVGPASLGRSGRSNSDGRGIAPLLASDSAVLSGCSVDGGRNRGGLNIAPSAGGDGGVDGRGDGGGLNVAPLAGGNIGSLSDCGNVTPSGAGHCLGDGRDVAPSRAGDSVVLSGGLSDGDGRGAVVTPSLATVAVAALVFPIARSSSNKGGESSESEDLSGHCD